jgi:propionyl-CoA carboxylase alpha chain
LFSSSICSSLALGISGVKVGQHVEAGQQLIVLEAMKMQNVLRAERAGTIKTIKKTVGSPVKVDEAIIEFD